MSFRGNEQVDDPQVPLHQRVDERPDTQPEFVSKADADAVALQEARERVDARAREDAQLKSDKKVVANG
jgi:hypothetical protein